MCATHSGVSYINLVSRYQQSNWDVLKVIFEDSWSANITRVSEYKESRVLAKIEVWSNKKHGVVKKFSFQVKEPFWKYSNSTHQFLTTENMKDGC